MALFTNEEKARLGQKTGDDFRRDGITNIPYDRPQVWAAAQAIRDVLDDPTFRATVSSAIDAATAPFAFTGPQKKRLVGRVIQEMVETEVA